MNDNNKKAKKVIQFFIFLVMIILVAKFALGSNLVITEIEAEVNGDEEEMLVDAVEEVQELPEIVYVEDEKKGYNWFKIFGYVAAALAVWLLLIYVVVAARK